jgi:hypothetical protein
MPAIVSQSRSTVFTTDPWARQNTIADINMMTLTLDSPTRPE